VTVDGPRRRPIERRLADAGLPPLPRTAWLEIDLDALTDNLHLLRDLAGPGIPVWPVVKADAYGHGGVPVTLALEAAGADGFCVAAMDEALELRGGGVRAPIVVLYPVPASWVGEALRLAIGLTAGDPTSLADVLKAAASAADTESSRSLELHLEIETGLGRGGFWQTDIVEAAALVASSPGVRLAGLWTHLQAAENEATTASQVSRFDAALAAVAARGIALPTRHLAASAALVGGGVFAHDAVRPGLAVFGLLPDELDHPNGSTSLVPAIPPFRPAMALLARPVRVIDLPTEWGVSYGPTFRTSRPSRIATLPIGYGDGWSRQLSNRASAIVRGVRVPLVGNVAMDAVMADVTDVPGPPVDAGDEFVLLGRHGSEAITMADLARSRTTNQWEVATNMSRRLPRVYHAASGPVGLRTLTGRRG
jgi:alanine racemase